MSSREFVLPDTSASSLAAAAAASSDDSTSQPTKKYRTTPPESNSHDSSSSGLLSPRIHTPQFHADSSFDSDFSTATPIQLLESSLFSPPQILPASAAPSAAPSSSDLSPRGQRLFEESNNNATTEHKAANSAAAAAATSSSAAASSSTVAMASSSHSSRNSSRSNSPAPEDPDLLQSTSSSSAAAQPQAKPNNTAKSSDPAGQTISEAELEGRFKVIRYLGKGSYGTVFVAEELATGKQVAIKKIPKVTKTLNRHAAARA